MSDTLLGKTSQLLIGAAANSKTSVTGVAQGTETIGTTKTRDTRRVPGGRGAIVVSSTPYVTNDFSFTTDSNSVNDPLLRAANGQRIYFTWRPEGNTTGKPQYIGSGVATTTLTLDPVSDSATWNVTVAVDGEPALSNIS